MEETTRIQKLLFSEYKNLLGEAILVESPFAETTREGRGLRQVALGLTRSRLIVATDVLKRNPEFRCHRSIDPSIETLELLSIYPLECVTLSVFRNKQRQALKARSQPISMKFRIIEPGRCRLIDGRAKYYELGGLQRRASRWRSWREHVQSLLECRCLGSSLSETSVAVTSSSLSSGRLFLSSRIVEEDAREENVRAATWTKKDLYLGALQEELFNGNYVPEPDAFVKNIIEKESKTINSPVKCKAKNVNRLVRKLCRFGCGVDENCSSSLCLDIQDTPSMDYLRFELLVENGVLVWEDSNKRHRSRSRRRSISTVTYFLNGLGPWSVQPGERSLIHSRRSRSCVALRRQPAEVELRLPVSRRQLSDNISLKDVDVIHAPSEVPLLFWTPDYWYRPRAITESRREAREHLAQLRLPMGSRRKVFHGKSTKRLRRALERIDHRATTLWNLDSTILARELTRIDRELFLNISARELELAIRQRTSRNATHLGAWVAFAERIRCLTASQILATGCAGARARLISRLLGAASRCLEVGNFHSARSIVAGLQSPGVYRLTETWQYLKTRHATKYELMEKLSGLFKSTSSKRYREAWMRAEQTKAGAIPFVGDVLRRFLSSDDDDGFDDERRIMDDDKRVIERKKVVSWLDRCQRRARAHELPEHSLAREVLLKARYLEGRENFFASLLLEPSFGES